MFPLFEKKRKGELTKEAPDNIAIKKPRQTKVMKALEGLSPDDIKNTDLKLVKAVLLNLIKTLAEQVNEDWHDGWEEQGETVQYFKSELKNIIESVFIVSVEGKRAFKRCYDILNFVSDCWDNLYSIPMRGSVPDAFSENGVDIEMSGEILFSVNSYEELLQEVWYPFLVAAAACTTSEKVTDEDLFQFIKTATEYEVNVGGIPDLSSHPRLDAAFKNTDAWEEMAPCRKKRKMKRGIDRRFDGEKSKRTRWFPEIDGDY